MNTYEKCTDRNMKRCKGFGAIYGASIVTQPFPYISKVLSPDTASELLCCLCLFLQILKINSQKDIESFVVTDFELIGYNYDQ